MPGKTRFSIDHSGYGISEFESHMPSQPVESLRRDLHGCRNPRHSGRRQLPFENGRTDLLTGNGSRLDIENINLLATLLIHAEHQGYWHELGRQFEEEMLSLLDRHLLAGLVSAPWVRSEDVESLDDTKFFSALQELVAYVFQESARVKKTSGILFSNWHELPARSSSGILYEMQSLLTKYRTEVIRQSCLHDDGDRT